MEIREWGMELKGEGMKIREWRLGNGE